MAHFGKSGSAVKSTPTEWLKVSSEIGTLVNKWAERDDLVVYVGGEMSAPVSALFDPATAEIEVNAKDAFGIADPEIVGDLNDRGMMYEFPKATGAILHEACHARFTQWSLVKSSKDLTPAQNEALHLLEEGRIEGLGVLTFPKNREFLRTSAMEIVIGDLDEEELAKTTTTRAMARMAGLVGGRIDAGVLEYSDVKMVIDLVTSTLGNDLYGKLRDLWRKAQRHTKHDNADDLYPLAIEWVRLVEERAKEQGEPEPNDGVIECHFPMPQEMIDKIKDVLKEAGEETGFSSSMSLGDQEEDERWEEDTKERASKAKEQTKNKEVEKKIFSSAKNSGSDTNGSASRLVETRKPTSAERVASVKVGQMLDKAKYRERDVTSHTSVLPQGRLRSRALVQGQALKSKGIMTPVEAWEYKTRKHTDEPTLSVGVMVDISGSMGGAMLPMATTAWVLAEAGRRVQAETAMVYYGSGVFPTLRRGQHLPEVNIYSAPDGTEKFDEGFRALDGHLNLLEGRGARLLVIVSDGHYSGSEPNNAKRWIDECGKRGVAVLWVTFDNDTEYVERRYLDGNKTARSISLAKSAPEQSAILIGTACAETLEQVGKRNQ